MQEGKERKRKGKMTSGIDLAWVEAKAKTARRGSAEAAC